MYVDSNHLATSAYMTFLCVHGPHSLLLLPPPCQVYHRVHRLPVPSMGERLLQHYRLGPVAGGVFVALISLVIMWYLLVCLWRPANTIQCVPSVAQGMSLRAGRKRKPSPT